MLTKDNILAQLRQQSNYLEQEFGVKRIGLFGSFATETATPTSDIDLVIEFNRPIGLKFIELCDYLETTLGRNIDILTPSGIANIRNPKIAQNINQTLIYA